MEEQQESQHTTNQRNENEGKRVRRVLTMYLDPQNILHVVLIITAITIGYNCDNVVQIKILKCQCRSLFMSL